MKTIQLTGESTLDFSRASAMAEAEAKHLLGQDVVCLSWYDRPRNHECPAHASECHDGSCPIPGYIEYAQSRGADLKIIVNDGMFVFCYLSVKDFTGDTEA